MRSTLTRLAVVIVGLFATAAIAGGTAQAEDEPEILELTCPPFCEVPNPPLEFCFEPNPEDCQKEDDPVILELTCPPLCPEPEDEETTEPEDEPTDEPEQPPANEPAPQPASGGADEPVEPAPTIETNVAEQDDAIVAPVNDFQEQPATSGGSSNGALLAVLATGFGLAAGGGLAYAVMRRR